MREKKIQFHNLLNVLVLLFLHIPGSGLFSTSRHGLMFGYDDNILYDYTRQPDYILQAYSGGEKNISAGPGMRNVFLYQFLLNKYIIHGEEDTADLYLEYERRKILEFGTAKAGFGGGHLHYFKQSELTAPRLYVPLELRIDRSESSIYFPLRFQYLIYPSSDSDCLDISFRPKISMDPVNVCTIDVGSGFRYNLRTTASRIAADGTDSGENISSFLLNPAIRGECRISPHISLSGLYEYNRYISTYAVIEYGKYYPNYDNYRQHSGSFNFNAMLTKSIYLSINGVIEKKIFDKRPAYLMPAVQNGGTITDTQYQAGGVIRILITKNVYASLYYQRRKTDSNDFYRAAINNKFGAKFELVF